MAQEQIGIIGLMPTKRVLLLADHAWRDIPGLAVVQVQLEKMLDCEVVIADIHLFADCVEIFKPHLVVLQHLHDPARNDIVDRVRRRGGLCVLLPTEGRVNTDEQMERTVKDWPHELCDLYCAWSDKLGGELERYVRTTVTGCPRFDFYFPPLSSLISPRDQICSMYHLDADKPVITIASSFPQAKFYWRGIDFIKNDWERLGVTRIPGKEDVESVIKSEYESFRTFQSWLQVLRATFPTLQIILKPHPAEDVTAWREFSDHFGIKLMLTDYIFNLLSASDLHVGRVECLTINEAWIAGKPTIQLNIGDVGKSGAGMEARAYGHVVSSTESFLGAVEEILDDRYDDKFDYDGSQAYLVKWLGPMPDSGKRVVTAIAELLNEKQPQTHQDPSADDRFALHRLLETHSRANSEPRTDQIGQFAKACRLEHIQTWVRAIRSLSCF